MGNIPPKPRPVKASWPNFSAQRLPANAFHFQGRGELREGNWADIIVFDADKIQDNATDQGHVSTTDLSAVQSTVALTVPSLSQDQM